MTTPTFRALATALVALISLGAFAALGARAEVSVKDATAASPAGQNKRIIEMDGLYLLSFGPRSAHAARDLMAALYPGLGERRAGE